MDPGGRRPQATDRLTAIGTGYLSPRNGRIVEDEGFSCLRGLPEPPEAAADGVQVIVPTRVGQVQQGHGSHRVLMDGVDRIALDDLAGPRVVVPPPLTGFALSCTDSLSYRLRHSQGRPVIRASVQAREGLQRVNLVGKGAHMIPVPRGTSGAGSTRKERPSTSCDEPPRSSVQMFLYVGQRSNGDQSGDGPCGVHDVRRTRHVIYLSEPFKCPRQGIVTGLRG